LKILSQATCSKKFARTAARSRAGQDTSLQICAKVKNAYKDSRFGAKQWRLEADRLLLPVRRQMRYRLLTAKVSNGSRGFLESWPGLVLNARAGPLTDNHNKGMPGMSNSETDNRDSIVDATAILILIMIVVSAAVYWVAGQ
jgi:hypothetical protein